MIKIRILTENTSRKRHMLAEHGLSIWIETDNKKILFDTGQSSIFSLNAMQAGIDLSKADMVVLSHGHYDHTGGAPEFCRINSTAPVYIQKGAFLERFNGNGEPRINIGVPWVKQGGKCIEIPNERLIINKGMVEINENIVLLSEIPSIVAFEDVPQNFYIDDGNGNISPDMIADEQILLIKGNKGVYIFVGCSHVGIINCIKHAQKIFPDEKIAAVIGGMHLNGVSNLRLENTIQYFIDHSIKKIIPLHCTGMLPACEMKRLLKERCDLLTVGDEFIFE